MSTELNGIIRSALGSRSITLVGLMGCGKSSVGRRVANRLELPFVDADDEIEKAAGKPIKEIFIDHGEQHFRDGERKVIARLLGCGPQVLATGGGAFMNSETRDNIRQHGVSIWLRAELPILLRRVQKRPVEDRPKLQPDPETALKALMELRYPVYRTADIVVDSRDVPREIIVHEVVEALRNYFVI